MTAERRSVEEIRDEFKLETRLERELAAQTAAAYVRKPRERLLEDMLPKRDAVRRLVLHKYG